MLRRLNLTKFLAKGVVDNSLRESGVSQVCKIAVRSFSSKDKENVAKWQQKGIKSCIIMNNY